MTYRAGFFHLTRPSDLFQKLGRELGRLQAAPHDVDHAFNFFVTAEHLPDWLGSRRRSTRKKKPILLQVVWDIASGAKHFKLRKSHKSVASTTRQGNFADRHWARKHFAKDHFGATLIINLSGDAAKDLGGPSITALDLAEQVHGYWSVPGRVPA
jgi:hypothetical protein